MNARTIAFASLLMIACDEARETVPDAAVRTDAAIAQPPIDAGRPISIDAGTDAGRRNPLPPDAGAHDAGTDACALRPFYRDGDRDRHGDAAMVTMACEAPAGYVADSTDCDDGDPAVNPGARELCDALDNDCTGVAVACEGLAGVYAGTYRMHTDERVGSAIVNQMTCTGTSAITVDLAASPVLRATLECAYSGGLRAFGRRQTASLEASLAPDGTITGHITHRFEPPDSSRTFEFTGTWTSAGRIEASGTGTWRPHPMSAVPWGVEFSFSATR